MVRYLCEYLLSAALHAQHHAKMDKMSTHNKCFNATMNEFFYDPDRM